MAAHAYVAASLLLGALLMGTTVATPEQPLDNVVTRWLHIAQHVNRLLPGTIQLRARVYAQLSTAQMLAIKRAQASKGQADADLAAAFAAHGVLGRIHPEQLSDVLDGPLLKDINAAGVSLAVRKKSEYLGVQAAVKMVSIGVGDKLGSVSYFKAAPQGSNDGRWEWIPGAVSQVYPQMGECSTFIVPRKKMLELVEPYVTGALAPNFTKDNPEFIANMEWVRAYGGKVSTQRTQYQTDTASFWLGGLTDGYVAGLVGTMQNVSIQLVPNTWGTYESARFFAALNTGIYDAFVAAWNIKYRIPVWRPITSIRHLTDDTTWEPLLTTPGHPEFPSGHQAVFGAFWGVIMKQLRNTTQLATPVVVTTEVRGLAPRTYTDLNVMAAEAWEARVYAGAHYNISSQASMGFARAIAEYNYDNLDQMVWGERGTTWGDQL